MTAAAWGRVLPGLGIAGMEPARVELDMGRASWHELAARALYGQPFGFTRAQLAALRWGAEADAGQVGAPPPFELADRIALEAAGVPMLGSHEEEPEQCAALMDLISQAVARVEALLPPDDPDEEREAQRLRAPLPHAIPPALRGCLWDRVKPGRGLSHVHLSPFALAFEPHTLAARALYGQPFGFTRAHLAALRFMDLRAEESDYLALGRGLLAVARNLPAASLEAVELVAALLPPD